MNTSTQLSRQEIITNYEKALLILKELEKIEKDEDELLRKIVKKEIEILRIQLNKIRIPESIKLGIVGRFKVGKSSFINEIIEEKFAKVNTSPETATITIFKSNNNEKTRIEIEYISKEEWDSLKELYEDKEVGESEETRRYYGFNNFEEIKIDKEEIVKEKIKKSGYIEKIEFDWNNNEKKKEVKEILGKYTSSSYPYHYLINIINIYIPSKFLNDGIELIDTPGLDDTQIYRVELTEKIVNKVDVILYLTTCGSSYSKSDKDFIIRQLRKNKIKDIIIVITKADETYKNKLDDCEASDIEPPSYELFIEEEIKRVKKEVKEILKELLNERELNDDDGYRYIKILDEIEICVISTKKNNIIPKEYQGLENIKKIIDEKLNREKRFKDSIEQLEIIIKKTVNSVNEKFEDIQKKIESPESQNEERKKSMS